MKKCAKCDIFKILSKFPKDKSGKNGLSFQCKQCKSIQDSQYRKENSSKVLAKQKVYYEANRSKYIERSRKYRKDNPEAQRAAKRRCKIAKPDHYAQMNRKKSFRRRAIKLKVTVENFTDIEVFERDNWMCGICNKIVDMKLKWPNPQSVSLDHIIALSKGGAHSRENTQCSHLICNVIKRERSFPIEYCRRVHS